MESHLRKRRRLIPFRGTLLPQIFTDTLVIGGGVAGLRSAIEAAQHGEVILLCKQSRTDSSTQLAQGGIAAAVNPGDSVESHFADTLAAGGDLCDGPAVRALVEAAPGAMEQLQQWDMRWDVDEAGEPQLGLEGGHSAPRILHTDGDATGSELSRCLWDRVRKTPTIRVFDACFALDLLTPGGGTNAVCMGAITHHNKYGLQMVWAKATILATGGAGLLWRETTNPSVATGDGLAMAYRAGATLADLAFMQFHPTALYIAGASRALISEAVRWEGAVLVDRDGYRFMEGLHERAELAPRDVVSRAISDRMEETGQTCVYLDARPITGFSRRFPGIANLLTQFEIDPARDLIPIRPAAHYMVGGVRTDLDGRTTLPGLYAVGECACTGVNGANRLASNSLLEGLVFGQRAGCASEEMRSSDNAWGVSSPPAPMQIVSTIPDSDRGELDLDDVRSSLRSVMWRNVGIVRAHARLSDVTEMFDFWSRYVLDKIFDEPNGWETQNMLLVGALVTRSALWRQESRGCHARTDSPEARPSFRVHDLWRRGEEEPTLEPVVDVETAVSREE
jgi:L-aspartate oxidase